MDYTIWIQYEDNPQQDKLIKLLWKSIEETNNSYK